jgi:hypothetical protein
MDAAEYRLWWEQNAPVPYGFCWCGCGTKTNIAHRDNAPKGWVKGQPLKFVFNHHRRKSGVDYIEVDQGHETPCWIWQRAQLIGTKNGKKNKPYGQIWFQGRTTVAHRAYYELENGPIPEGLVLHHLCEQTLCIRPGHLQLMTSTRNTEIAFEAMAARLCPCCEGRGWLPIN